MSKQKPKYHTLRKKSYNSLSEVRREILEKGIEKVLDFNGYELTTNRGVYGLADGEVSFREKGK